jgi:hypothetical protein
MKFDRLILNGNTPRSYEINSHFLKGQCHCFSWWELSIAWASQFVDLAGVAMLYRDFDCPSKFRVSEMGAN